VSKRPNPRWVKVHRNYTVEEVATLFGIHKNTVRDWVKRGLPLCDDKRPLLILGRDLSAFLTKKRAVNKQVCQLGEFYCLRCRAPRKPAEGMVDYEAITDKVGNLMALCEHCGSLINRRVSVTKLPQFNALWGVSFPLTQKHISDGHQASLNSDFKRG
jgi:hypothetical protein